MKKARQILEDGLNLIHGHLDGDLGDYWQDLTNIITNAADAMDAGQTTVHSQTISIVGEDGFTQCTIRTTDLDETLQAMADSWGLPVVLSCVARIVELQGFEHEASRVAGVGWDLKNKLDEQRGKDDESTVTVGG